MKSIEIGTARAAVVAIGIAVASLAYADAQSPAAGQASAPEAGGAAVERSSQAAEAEAAIARTGLAGKLAAALGSDFGGVWFDASTARLHVGVTSPASRLNAEAVAAQLGVSEILVETPVESTQAQLEASLRRLNRSLDDLFEDEQVRTGLSPDRNAVGVELASSVSPARRTALESAAAAEGVEVSIDTSLGRSTRGIQTARCGKFVSLEAKCDPTIVGGVTITGPKKLCSAGPAVLLKNRANKDAATATFILTAGHCIANDGGNGVSWFAYKKGSATKEEIGEAAKHINGPTDEGVIELKDTSVWGKANDPTPVVPAVAAWDLTKETDPTNVLSQAEPVVGSRSCLSGQRSGKRCGKILTENASGTFSGVKTEELVEVDLEKTKAGAGDSGGPWAAEAAPSAVEGIMVGVTLETAEEGKFAFYQPLKVVFEKLEKEFILPLELLKHENEYRHPKVKAGTYPVTIHGSSTATQKFNTEAGAVECKASTFHAVLSAEEKETSKLTLTPQYKECKASFLGFAATVEMEGCAYVLHLAEKAAADDYRAYTDISCSAGKSIKIVAGTCKAEIKAQTERETVDLVDDTSASPKKDITMRPTLAGLAYTVTQDGAFCPFSGTGEKTGGEYTSAEGITLTGQSTVEPATKIDIEITGP
jgi:Trypsin